MNEASEIIRMDNVTVALDGHVILNAINLSIMQNDYLGIIGPNGGGKTTLLRTILGLIRPMTGKISIMGEPPERGRKYIGYVPQHAVFDRDFPIDVWDTVMMGRLPRSSPLRRFSEDDSKQAEKALSRVGMTGLEDRSIGNLSGGERQRVYIARALATDPKVLLLDEPTANIDVEMEEGFYNLLNEIRKTAAIVLVSHDISVISVHVDKIACLNRELYMHTSSEIDAETLEKTYRCPVEMIAHGVPHRVLKDHDHKRRR